MARKPPALIQGHLRRIRSELCQQLGLMVSYPGAGFFCMVWWQRGQPDYLQAVPFSVDLDTGSFEPVKH
jgi:hypothetical protein